MQKQKIGMLFQVTDFFFNCGHYKVLMIIKGLMCSLGNPLKCLLSLRHLGKSFSLYMDAA